MIQNSGSIEYIGNKVFLSISLYIVVRVPPLSKIDEQEDSAGCGTGKVVIISRVTLSATEVRWTSSGSSHFAESKSMLVALYTATLCC